MRSSKNITPIYGAVLLLMLVRVVDQIRRDQKRAVQAEGRLAEVDELIVHRSSKSGYSTARSLSPTRRTSRWRPSQAEDDDGSEEMLVRYGDSIYVTNDWDGSPVVLEKSKLVFFTTPKIGCTTWKQLFRRMMNKSNWNIEEYSRMIPWNPQTNGLRYLYDYDRETANTMMTSPEWTRAIFVREPKERFLSAYLDKVKKTPQYLREKCCGYTGTCVTKADASIAGFLQVAYYCNDGHWRPQNMRMEAKYWPYINFVGRMETLREDAERLLKQVGAWEKYGASGWGVHGNQSAFGAAQGGAGRRHSTDAKSKLQAYLTPELEAALEEYYADDYLNPVLNFTLIQVYA